ncbi:unnamed protein product [Dicrocoelium dendriticum]|nr:unnamed protein product [Dicrocoelium dendriticum]
MCLRRVGRLIKLTDGQFSNLGVKITSRYYSAPTSAVTKDLFPLVVEVIFHRVTFWSVDSDNKQAPVTPYPISKLRTSQAV